MGVVYLADQERPVRRRVALKVIKLGMDTREVIARFESERQALAMMNHPNIAKVFDAGTTEQGRSYFVMEQVPGVPITDYCDRHRLTTKERLELFIPVCQAIHHAHQKAIIHRDVKPSNVIVMIQDGKPVPKVIDFGVAKALNQRLTEKTVFTEQGKLIGTPSYMSPEQAEMTGLNVDTTTDVYSLGVLLYELLVGALPFDTKVLLEAGWDALHRMIRDVDPPKPSTKISTLGEKATAIAVLRRTEPAMLERQLRGELDWITMRAMAKDRIRRYQSASELAADVEHYLANQPVLARPPSAVYQIRKLVARHKVGVAFATTVFLLLIAFAITMSIEREKAVLQARKAERIKTFLQDVLASADPDRARGPGWTVREFLDEVDQRVAAELQDQPEIQAALQSTIGRTYASLGLYDRAEGHLAPALMTQQRVLGPKHPDVAASLNALGSLALLKGDYAMADSLLRKTVSTYEALYGHEHPAVATGLNNLAYLLAELGELTQADSLYNEVLRMRVRLLGERDPEVATTESDLAIVLQHEGKSAQAESLLRKALETWIDHYGETHLDVATGMNNLAVTLQEQGQYAKAESLYWRAKEIYRKLLGEEHPEYAISVMNLGYFLQLQGKYEQAEPLYRQALAIQRKSLGDHHEDVARTLNGLAWVLQARGEYDESERLYREALEMFRSLFGDEHPQVARTLSNVAFLLRERGRNQEAEPPQLQSLALHKKLYGLDHPLVARSIQNTGRLRAAQGRSAEAESLFLDALAVHRRIQGEQHPDVADVLSLLGNLLIDRKEAARAETLLNESLGIRRKAFKEGDWRITITEAALAECLAAQGHCESAESLVVDSYARLTESHEGTLSSRCQAMASLMEASEACEMTEFAARCRKDLSGMGRQ